MQSCRWPELWPLALLGEWATHLRTPPLDVRLMASMMASSAVDDGRPHHLLMLSTTTLCSLPLALRLGMGLGLRKALGSSLGSRPPPCVNT